MLLLAVKRLVSFLIKLFKAFSFPMVSGYSNAYGAVSYTHLDVYKRQLLAVVGPAEPIGLPSLAGDGPI